MENFTKSVNNDGKVAMSLAIAEKIFEIIEISDEGYELGRSALDDCWRWLESKEIEANDLCDYVDHPDGETDISEFCYTAVGKEQICAWGVILYAVSYVSWRAYKEDGYPPESLDNTNDNLLATMIETALETGMFEIESINAVKEYLLKNYPATDDSSHKAIIKQDII
ncbi:Imm6 family immunity protein [Clostridium sp. SHJSY1]|uniref:Imm6 family immunity protein n=1 Tax=Clostridium sp. SHJSY1 TaxID=2942483 RepID=UPI00287679DC|nr:Imm6 family immunity protein [Clostridium sp. SHJSY1]MDS0526593.1 Imm6 family immunity protein [Clostridium sp. SHJSY1]